MKRIISTILIVLLTMTGINVFADTISFTKPEILEDNNETRVVTQEEAARIEKLLEENSVLENALNSDLGVYSIEHIENKITENKKELEELGASAPSDDLLKELIIASEKASQKSTGVSVCSSWTPAELVSSFSSMYDMSGSYTTSYDGKQQYHLVFRSNGSDSYLSQAQTKVVIGKVTAGSNEAAQWVNELIEIYASKLFGSVLSEINDVLNVIPYEVLGLVAKPDPDTIYSSGNSLTVMINTGTFMKFVYVKDPSTNEWVFALSTNKVEMDSTFVVMMNINGSPKNDEFEEFKYISGSYNNAVTNANTAFEGGYELNTCITELVAWSNAKNTNIIRMIIHSPSYIAGML